MRLEELPYCEPIKQWLAERYGPDAEGIWSQIEKNYLSYLAEVPDYGGKKNGHAKAIYGGLLIFAWYPPLPDHPAISELQDFVQNLFMGSFTKLGKVFNLNRDLDLWLIDKVFRRSGNRDRKDIQTAAGGKASEPGVFPSDQYAPNRGRDRAERGLREPQFLLQAVPAQSGDDAPRLPSQHRHASGGETDRSIRRKGVTNDAEKKRF